MLRTHFFLFKVRISPWSGEDVITCVNPDGLAYDENELVLALGRLHQQEAHTASIDEGVLIQRVNPLFAESASDDMIALSYSEVAKKLQIA